MKLIYSYHQIDEIAGKIVRESTSKTLCFYGQMGAGKTTVIKAIVKELGGADNANSPTFGIVNEYRFKTGELLGYHFDFYRLDDEFEALDLGFEDYLNDDVWIFIEWPEKIASLLPEATTDLFLEVLDRDQRALMINEK